MMLFHIIQGHTSWAIVSIHSIFILNPGFYYAVWRVCFRNKLGNSPGGIKTATKNIHPMTGVFLQGLSSKQGGPCSKWWLEGLTQSRGAAVGHSPSKTSQQVRDYKELVSKYHWKQSHHYIYTLPSPFISLNRHLMYNQNIGTENTEISAQRLHIHCLFWFVSQIQKSLNGSRRHMELRYCLEQGWGGGIHCKRGPE